MNREVLEVLEVPGVPNVLAVQCRWRADSAAAVSGAGHFCTVCAST